MLSDKKTKNPSINKLNKEKKKKWTQDWRGKALGIFISSIILIGAAIPSGMAISGYFSKNFGLTTNIGDLTSNNILEKIKNDINVAKNNAIIWQFDEMHKQGWFDDRYYKNFSKRVKKNSENKVQEEKDGLHEQYGNTWKNEYNKFLAGLGFDNENEWINSMISDEYKQEEIKKFSSKNYIINTSVTDDYNWEQSKNAKYISKSKNTYNSKETVKYINNSGWRNDGEEVKSYSLTSEKFMDYFIKYYQPVLFNDSLLQFTPVSGGDSTESNISAGNINTNTDKIYNSIIFLQKLSDPKGFTPAAINYQGIQSGAKISLEDSIANISLGMLIDATDLNKITLNQSKTTINIKDIITSSLAKASLNINSSKEEVEKITNDDIDKYEEQILIGIKEIIGDTNSKNRKFDSSTTISTKKIDLKSDGTYDWKNENMEYSTYISDDGLHVTGIQDSGKNLIVNYLNYLNFKSSIIDSDFLFDSGLIEKFTSFVNTIYDNAVLISWLNSPDGDIESIGEFNENELKTSWISTIWSYSRSQLEEKYDEGKTFFEDNGNIYNYNEFIEINFYEKLKENNNLYKDAEKQWNALENLLDNNDSKIITLKKEEENE